MHYRFLLVKFFNECLSLVFTTYSNALSNNIFDTNTYYPSYFESYIKKTRFIKQIWKTKKIFHFNYFNNPNSSNIFNSIHFVIKFIKSWDINLSFFVNGYVTFTFSSLSFNRLKNIFLKSFREPKLWSEIHKMFKHGILSFSSSKIYWGLDIYSFSLLSRYLLNFYLFELDKYVGYLLSKSNSIFTVFRTNYFGNSNYSTILLKSLPLKLERNLLSYKNLVSFNSLRFNSFSTYFNASSDYISCPTFKRRIFGVRYINFFLFGFIASKNYANFVMDKIVSFIRSDLLLNLFKTDINFHYRAAFYFLGFNISLKNVKVNIPYANSFNFSDKYLGRVKFRIYAFRKKLLNLIIERVNSEVFLHFVSCLQQKKLFSFSFRNKKLWSLIFQLECVKSLSYDKVLFSQDTMENLNYPFYSSIKMSNILFYRKYSLNLYVKKLQIVFKGLINSTNTFFRSSTLPIDVILSKHVSALNKKIYFIYENLYFNIVGKDSLENAFGFSDQKRVNITRKIWHVSVPKSLIFRKLRGWGFIHPYKNRPISNSRMLFLDDSLIINKFNSLLNKFLTWFRCCDDFLSVKFFIEILRQSCFLTICRKHNKSKVWAYSVFTPTLFSNRSFFESNRSFFSTVLTHKFKKKCFFSKTFFLFDEKLFLTKLTIFEN